MQQVHLYASFLGIVLRTKDTLQTIVYSTWYHSITLPREYAIILVDVFWNNSK
jgi:hypothetical protein